MASDKYTITEATFTMITKFCVMQDNKKLDTLIQTQTWF